MGTWISEAGAAIGKWFVEIGSALTEFVMNFAASFEGAFAGMGATAAFSCSGEVAAEIAGLSMLEAVPLVFLKRREEDLFAIPELNLTQIKCVYHPFDVALNHPLSVGHFNVTDLFDNGTANFVWHNYTDQPGTLSDLWVDENKNLIFPDQNDDGTYPWYPNGTLFGTDAEGRPIGGIWTTELNEKDQIALQHLHAKQRHIEEFQAKYPGRPLPSTHMTFTPLDKLPRKTVHGKVWSRMTRNFKRSEEEQARHDYHAIEKQDTKFRGGDKAMYRAAHDALVDSAKELGR